LRKKSPDNKACLEMALSQKGGLDKSEALGIECFCSLAETNLGKIVPKDPQWNPFGGTYAKRWFLVGGAFSCGPSKGFL
jgi:hypothetical protein